MAKNGYKGRFCSDPGGIPTRCSASGPPLLEVDHTGHLPVPDDCAGPHVHGDNLPGQATVALSCDNVFASFVGHSVSDYDPDPAVRSI